MICTSPHWMRMLTQRCNALAWGEVPNLDRSITWCRCQLSTFIERTWDDLLPMTLMKKEHSDAPWGWKSQPPIHDLCPAQSNKSSPLGNFRVKNCRAWLNNQSNVGIDQSLNVASSATEAMTSPVGCDATHATESLCALIVFFSRILWLLLLLIEVSVDFGTRNVAVAAKDRSDGISVSCKTAKVTRDHDKCTMSKSSCAWKSSDRKLSEKNEQELLCEWKIVFWEEADVQMPCHYCWYHQSVKWQSHHERSSSSSLRATCPAIEAM